MHFFIDHTKLTEQTTSELKYGPNSSDPNNVFNISTQFQLPEEARAFACQNGMMVVRRNSNDPDNLVNLYIKPSNSVSIGGIAVRYYIYRGVKLSSFFTKDGSNLNINAEDPTNSEFIALYWNRRTLLGTKSYITMSPSSPLNIGYGDDSLSLSDPNNLNENRPIRDLFNGKAPAKAFDVKEGMWIGDFSNSAKISFEIQLDTELKSTTTLGNSAFNAISISVDGINDEQVKKRKQEFITTYIDPAAFFGMHADIGVEVTTYSGSSKNTETKKLSNGLYSDLISKFANKNKIYLDIKSEKGMSYNFYDNYKVSISDSSNIKLNGAGTPIEYGTNGWPIMFFETLANETTQDRKKLSFKLRIDNNNTPILFLSNKAESDKTASKQISFLNIKKDGTTGWTNEVYIYPKHIGDTNKNNLANYIKVYYFVGEAIDTDSTRLKNKTYYDSPFCSIDIENIGEQLLSIKMLQSYNPVYVKEPLQSDGTGNFSFVAESGVYWDSSQILFYSKKTFPGGTYQEGSGKKYLPTFNRQLKIETLNNHQFKQSLRDNFDITCKKYQTSNGDLKVLGLNSYHQYHNPADVVVIGKKPIKQLKEDLILLGLTLSELQSLKSVTGLSPDHPKYIFLEPDFTNFLLDNHNMRYFKFKVKVQGLNNGIPTIVAPTTPVIVYSRDKQFFHSVNFVEHEEYSIGRNFAGENRIEFSIYHDGRIKINDNIDFALIRKSEAVDEHFVRKENHTQSDNVFGALMPIYYKYIRPNSFSPTDVDIAQFNIVMTNEMKKKGDGKKITSEYSLVTSYTRGDTKRNLKSPVTGHIISSKQTTGSVGYKHYENTQRKTFMIHFVTSLSNTDLPDVENRIFDDTNNQSLGIDLVYRDTRRTYGNPYLCAIVLGVVIRNGRSVTLTGFAFGDASCAPSASHVNGMASDNRYFQQWGGTLAQDVEFIDLLFEYGISYVIIGKYKPAELLTQLKTKSYYSAKNVIQDTKDLKDKKGNFLEPRRSLHDDHLHAHLVL